MSIISTGTGIEGAWSSWTPSLGGLTGGTITYAKFKTIGKTVFWRFKYTLGGAGVTGEVTLVAPVLFHADYSVNVGEPLGNVVLQDTGTALYHGVASWGTGGVILLRVGGAASTYTNPTALSSTIPFTWANTDIIMASGFYEGQ